jgi:hypothetical protein
VRTSRGGLSRSQIGLLPWKFSGSMMAYLREISLIKIIVNSIKPIISLWELCVIVANMASYAISSSLIFVIHDNMINGTNHIV